MAQAGFTARMTIGLLGVSESGYYAWRERTPSARSLRQAWLSRIIRDIHHSSGAVFGYRRIRQELGHRYGINVSHQTVERLMGQAGLRGRSGRVGHHSPGPATAPGTGPGTAPGTGPGSGPAGGMGGRRWIIDVDTPDHPHAVWWAAIVLDTTTHRLIAFSTGRRPTSHLIDQALDQAITQEAATPPTPDTAGELAGCSFTARAHTLRRAPGSGTVGDWYEHSLTEAFWRTLRSELAHHARPGADHHGQALLDTLERLTRQP
ncbi:IS3 family transposase [Streptomyces sp. MBT84]|uniref:IS3 family transposase n=2 Tax=unclassified Streptomyces TaxID=2593676 RepID=UPI001C6E2349|nr:IS3 family transposase [Streptomyces sp. MBT84]